MRALLLALLFLTNPMTVSATVLEDNVFFTKLFATIPSYADYDINFTTYPFPVVNGKASREGYPIYAMTCYYDEYAGCYGESGQFLGSVKYVASKLTPVSTQDAMRKDWNCEYICTDNEDNVVGAPNPELYR